MLIDRWRGGKHADAQFLDLLFLGLYPDHREDFLEPRTRILDQGMPRAIIYQRCANGRLNEGTVDVIPTQANADSEGFSCDPTRSCHRHVCR